MDARFIQANYLDTQQAMDIGCLMNAYAQDPMGGGKALGVNVINNLAKKLSEVAGAFTILCYVEDRPVGLINCLMGFSTFSCKPLVNLHDVFLIREFRGFGLSQKMLIHVEATARQRGCCKLTMEVLEGNRTAQYAYKKFGFDGYELDPDMGKALFWQKSIN